MAAKKKKNVKNGVSNFFAVIISVLAVFVFTTAIVGGYVVFNALSDINGATDKLLTISGIKSKLDQTTFLYATDSAGETVELAMVENLQREDLNPIEEAAAYKSLMTEHNMTQEELHKAGINESMIHVDFMIGSRDLEITGYDKKGKEYPIFKNGNFCF